MKNIFKIVLVIVGAFIGAGFASGKEIYTFFYAFGSKGIIGLIISSLLLIMVIYKTLSIISKNEIYNYKEFLDYIIKDDKDKYGYIKSIINNIVNILILISFFIMVAGFGAYFKQEFNVSSIVGSAILAILSYIILNQDTKGLVKTNEILVPIVIVVIIIIGIICIEPQHLTLNINTYTAEKSKFLLNSILYCSYNCMLLIPVLITMKNYIKNKKTVFLISSISGIVILLLSLIMFFILNSNIEDITNVELPVLYILKNNLLLKNIYGIIILVSIFTTAISLGSGFVKNITKNKKSYPQITKIMCIIAVFVSQIGFSNLVNYLYPIFGYIGILQIIKLFMPRLEKIKKN